MGYVMIVMPCASCGRTISCNPNHVPSIKNDNDKKVPLCFDCATELNRLFEKAGKESVPIHSEAYNAEDENRLVW